MSIENKFINNEIYKNYKVYSLGFDFYLHAETTIYKSYKMVPIGFDKGKFVYDKDHFIVNKNQSFNSVELKYKNHSLGKLKDLTLFDFISCLKSLQHNSLTQFSSGKKEKEESRINYSTNENYKIFLKKKQTIPTLHIVFENDEVYIDKFQCSVIDSKINYLSKFFKENTLFTYDEDDIEILEEKFQTTTSTNKDIHIPNIDEV